MQVIERGLLNLRFAGGLLLVTEFEPPMTSDSTRSSLLLRLRDPANQGAWREFESKYRELIIRYCRGHGLGHTDAEDVCQAVMIRLTKSLPDFAYARERGRFRNFLGKIVRNEVIRHIDRPEHHGRLQEEARAAVISAQEQKTADAVWESEWMHHHLRMAIDHVRGGGDGRAVAIFEGFLAGQTAGQIATAFQMTADAVYKAKQRIRDRIKARVAAQIAEEDDTGE